MVISGAEKTIQSLWGLSPSLHRFAIASALYGTVVGALMGGWPADRFGRPTLLPGRRVDRDDAVERGGNVQCAQRRVSACSQTRCVAAGPCRLGIPQSDEVIPELLPRTLSINAQPKVLLAVSFWLSSRA